MISSSPKAIFYFTFLWLQPEQQHHGEAEWYFFSNLKTELQKHKNITSVSGASHVPAAGTTYGAGIKRKLEDSELINADYFFVDEDYNKNMELKVLAGDFFQTKQGESNTNFVVINEAALKKLKFQTARDAIGEPIRFMNDSSSKVVTAVV